MLWLWPTSALRGGRSNQQRPFVNPIVKCVGPASPKQAATARSCFGGGCSTAKPVACVYRTPYGRLTDQRGGRGRIQCCCKKSTKARTFGRSRRVRRVRMLNGVAGR
jgi:hypothetical protein